jgi:hypothetical protein
MRGKAVARCPLTRLRVQLGTGSALDRLQNLRVPTRSPSQRAGVIARLLIAGRHPPARLALQQRRAPREPVSALRRPKQPPRSQTSVHPEVQAQDQEGFTLVSRRPARASGSGSTRSGAKERPRRQALRTRLSAVRRSCGPWPNECPVGLEEQELRKCVLCGGKQG